MHYALIAALFVLSGCIKDDLPYPRIQQNILTLDAEGSLAPAAIDDKELTATIRLDESTDPKRVRFTDFTYTKGAECSRNLLEGTYDLTKPLQLTLSLYQEYTWTITAIHEIERYFTISGQVGETAIDVPGRRIVLYMPDTNPLTDLTITSVKMGPAGKTAMTPAWKAGDVINAVHPVHLTVTYFGEVQDWTLYVDKTKALCTTTAVNAWVNVIWAYGQAEEGEQNGFQYREADASDWIDVPASSVQHDGGSFSCCIPHLKALTSYVVRAVSGDNYGEEKTVTTLSGMDIPDADLENWWLDKKVWCPWAEGGTPFWGTGNTGAATLGQSNVTPSDDTPSGIGKCARLETRFVGIGAIGKLAAGSFFAGTFVKVDGTNGILDFGRPWPTYPIKLHGYFKYNPATISDASTEFKSLIGRPDSCHMWVALTDMDAPCVIRTNPKNRKLFDRHDPGVIAYGEITRGTATDGWQPFEIKFNYNATNRRPTYMLLVFASSKYGDYFTGGRGSTLFVDQLSLSYDY